MSQKNAVPYIGVTGFMAVDEIVAIQSLFDPTAEHKLMVGVLMSSKTVIGLGNRYPCRYPLVDAVPKLLSAVNPEVAFGLVHYNSDRPSQIAHELHSFLAGRAGGVYDRFLGFQYNAVWPSAHSLRRIDQHYARWSNGYDSSHVLQIGPRALEDAPDVGTLTELVRGYYDVSRSRDSWPFSYILIDMSAGVGRELEWQRTEDILGHLLELTGETYGLRIGVAGGLSADNVHRLKPLVDLYPDLSIDAEGRLRDEDDRLDLVAATAYVQAAQEVLG